MRIRSKLLLFVSATPLVPDFSLLGSIERVWVWAARQRERERKQRKAASSCRRRSSEAAAGSIDRKLSSLTSSTPSKKKLQTLENGTRTATRATRRKPLRRSSRSWRWPTRRSRTRRSGGCMTRYEGEREKRGGVEGKREREKGQRRGLEGKKTNRKLALSPLPISFFSRPLSRWASRA